MTHKQLTMGQKKRIAVVSNIPIACNRVSADFILSSPLMADEYERLIPDYEPYKRRLQGRTGSVEGATA
jgi:methylglyoxal synthase